MPYGARALGQEGLRLRSRRVRSAKSARLSLRLAVVVLILAGLIGYFGASVGVAVSQLPSFELPALLSEPST
jgi:hypothetical protein